MESTLQVTANRIRGRADWLSVVQADHLERPSLTAKERADTLRAIGDEVRKGRTANALALARITAWIEPSAFLREARRIGVFRASKYIFRGEGVAHIVTTLLGDTPHIAWSESEQRYLRSAAALLMLAPAASKTRRALVATLRKKQRVVLKSCMVSVDRAFRPQIDQVPDAETLLAQTMGHPGVFSPEQKASGLSTIVALLQEAVGITPALTLEVDERGIRDGTYERLLQAAARLGLLFDAEVLIDAFPYSAEFASGTVTVEPLDDRFEQSVRLGYVQTDMQINIRRNATSSPKLAAIISLHDSALDFYRQVGSRIIQRMRTPVDRYVMALPLMPGFVNLLADKRLYREEVPYLQGLAIDSFMDFAELEHATMLPGITVFDVIRVQRLFSFIATVFFEALDQPVVDVNRDDLDMRSRIPIFPEQMLAEMMRAVIGNDAALRLLPMLSYDSSTLGYFDVQYTPLLRIGTSLMAPLSVLVASNIVRNMLCHHSARLLPANGKDPMQRAVRNSLLTAGFFVAPEVERTISGQTMEIDLVAYREGHLFLLECKNAFHPTDPHEMRTSYAHIEKAARQLERSRTWLSSAGAQATLFKELGWAASPTDNVHTCVVTANRVFTGYALNGHPIRQAHELRNVLDRGEITSGVEQFRIWRSEKFDIADLLDYLGDAGIAQDCFAAMHEHTVVSPIGPGGRLAFRTFALDTELLAQTTARKYTHLGPHPDNPKE